MAMMRPAKPDAAYEFVHSSVSSARNVVADPPNHAGTRQQTSLSEMGARRTCFHHVSRPAARARPSRRQSPTAVICMPG